MFVMFRLFVIFLIFLTLCIQSNNGLCGEMITKFVSLKGKQTNVRGGPSEEYKILRVYDKTFMPLEILHKIDNWYMISDYQNQSGWIRANLVNHNKKRRSVIFQTNAELCRFPVLKDKQCKKIATVDKGVVGIIRSCNKTWCNVKFDKYYISGFVKRENIWGLINSEIL